MSTINGKNRFTNSNIIRPYADKSEIIYLNEDNKIYNFVNNILEIRFDLYRKYGLSIDFTNNVFNSITKKSQKIIFEINIYYKWVDSNLPSRYYIEIIKNNNIYIKHSCGISDSNDINNLWRQFVIDVTPSDIIYFYLKKDDAENNKIEIIDNSYYIIKSLI